MLLRNHTYTNLAQSIHPIPPELSRADTIKLLERPRKRTESRERFSKEAHAYYTGQLIEDARKNALLTQDELTIELKTIN